jgi:hypothetical protein
MARVIAPMRHLMLVLALVLAACGSSVKTPAPTNGGVPSGGDAAEAELRIALIDALGPRWYCDPDEFPVAHGTEQERAIERYAEMVAEHDVFRAAAVALGIDPEAAPSDAQKLAIYRLWKVATSIPMEPTGDGRYRFDYTAQPVGGATEGVRTTGIVNPDRSITDRLAEPASEPICPICLSLGTLIDTPDGPIPVERLRPGDPVWTLTADGRRVAGTVIGIGSTESPSGHEVVRLQLEDGRTATASPGHPLGDGRLIGELSVGELVAGSRVVAADRIAYDAAWTYDLVASGETGIYFAGGIPLGSTLRPR